MGIGNFKSSASAIAGLALALMAAGCDRGTHPSEIGHAAPDFTVADKVSSLHLASYRGKVVLLNFWGSWCAPCIAELPSLEQFHHEHPEYPILAVSIDEDEDAYRRFVANRHVDFTTVWDPKESASALYKTTGWPETFIIDRNGMIRRRFIGATDWSDPEILQFLKTL
ncbi:MAG TPA: TlpA disulfide reductase family protein [Acidobacteriaceae bacterium]|nr:TlpA disulfide reductase family protein [Acidobacteriaceae bacterium]